MCEYVLEGNVNTPKQSIHKMTMTVDYKVEPLLSESLGRVTIRWIIEWSDNSKPKIMGFNGVGRVGLRWDN